MFEQPPFCDEFADKEMDEREAYVADELRRLDAEHIPLLRTVLGSSHDDVQQIALALLQSNAHPSGEMLFEEPRVWRLRLIKGVKPPTKDPQRRPLPKELQGKVLRCKIGNKGGKLTDPKAPAKLVDAHGGEKRVIADNAGRDLYDTVDVTFEPKSFVLRTAVLILRTWGYGVPLQRCLIERDRDGNEKEGQSMWLVEEVTPGAEKASEAA
jgi:hypothetical protein